MMYNTIVPRKEGQKTRNVRQFKEALIYVRTYTIYSQYYPQERP